MARLSILPAILIFCVIGAQGRDSRHRNSNTNVNSNSFRRNANTNFNTNTFSRRNSNSNVNSNTFGASAVDPTALLRHVFGDDDSDDDSGLMDPGRVTVKDVAECLTSRYGSDVTDEDIDTVMEAVVEIMGGTDVTPSYYLNRNHIRNSMMRRKLLKNHKEDVDSDDDVLPGDIKVPKPGATDDETTEEDNVNSNINHKGDPDGDDVDKHKPGGAGNGSVIKPRRVRMGFRVAGRPSQVSNSEFDSIMKLLREGSDDYGAEEFQGVEDLGLGLDDISEADLFGSRTRNSNSNVNTNTFRRNLNRNVNVNTASERKWGKGKGGKGKWGKGKWGK